MAKVTKDLLDGTAESESEDLALEDGTSKDGRSETKVNDVHPGTKKDAEELAGALDRAEIRDPSIPAVVKNKIEDDLAH